MILFIWIPKCCGTSVYHALREKHGMKMYLDDYHLFENKSSVTFGHLHIKDLLLKGIISDSYWNGAKKFCIVRNPYDRFVSLWLDYKRSKRIHEETTLSEFAWGMSNISRLPTMVNAFDFSQCASQVSWILPGVEILRFENIEHDIKKFGIDKLSHMNKGKADHYSKYYDDHSKNLVYKLYRDDFIVLGYGSMLHIG